MKQLLDFTGKVVLVTGARSGIGQAVAIAFAEQGAKVVLSGRRPCSDTEVAIQNAGGEAVYVQCDVSNENDIRHLIEQTIEIYGRLDIAVNNAGTLPPTADLTEQTTADFNHTFDVDARGVFLCMKHEIAQMLKNENGGAIINIASVAGLIADPGMTPYVGAKHAVTGLTKAAAIEYADRNIRINAIAPGFVRTEITAGWMDDPEMLALVKSYNSQHRFAEPEEIANVALFLGSDMASFMNGSIVVADAGQTAH